MRNEFEAREVAAAIGQANWADFLANMKRAKLSVLSPKGRGEAFSFAHLVEFDFQTRIGSKYSRDLAKIVFFKFAKAATNDRPISDIEDNPEFFSEYIDNPHMLVFSRETANDATLFLCVPATTSVAEMHERFRRLALDGASVESTRRIIAASVETIIVFDVTSTLRRLATEA